MFTTINVLRAENDSLRAEVERFKGELASSTQTLADANRANDYVLELMRHLLARQDVHGIEEGADAVAKLVDSLTTELAAEKEKTSQAWWEFRSLSMRAGENYHNLLMRFLSIEARAAAAAAWKKDKKEEKNASVSQ